MNSRVKYCFKSILIIAAGILASCLALEIVLHFTDLKTYNALFNDERTGLLIYKPNTDYHTVGPCFENDSRINGLGFHARNISVQKGPDVFRIVIMGSSFTEAFQVPLEKNFSYLLERQLNADPAKKYTYEVIPFGMSGNGTYLNMIYFKKYAVALKPDLVIDMTTEYELTRNQASVNYPPRFDSLGQAILELPMKAQSNSLVFMKNAFRESKLLVNLYFRYLTLISKINKFLAHPVLFAQAPKQASPNNSAEPDRNELWKIEEKLLSQFASLASQENSRFLLVFWSSPQLDGALKKNYLEKFTAIAKQNSFPYFDLAPSMSQKEQQEAQSPVWTCDDHWNEFGHEWAADGIHDYLLKNPSLIQR